MPIIQSFAQSQLRRPDGTTSVLSAEAALRKDGPRESIAVSLSKKFSMAIGPSAINLPVDATQSGLALIDTGASISCIDETAAQELGLPVVGVTKIRSASHVATNKNLYPIYLEFLGYGVKFDLLQVPGAPLGVQGLLALIGRDVLSRCIYIHNGLLGLTTLSAP